MESHKWTCPLSYIFQRSYSNNTWHFFGNFLTPPPPVWHLTFLMSVFKNFFYFTFIFDFNLVSSFDYYYYNNQMLRNVTWTSEKVPYKALSYFQTRLFTSKKHYKQRFKKEKKFVWHIVERNSKFIKFLFPIFFFFANKYFKILLSNLIVQQNYKLPGLVVNAVDSQSKPWSWEVSLNPDFT